VTAALPWHTWAALGACIAAIFCAALAVLAPGPARLPLERRRPGSAGSAGALTEATDAATSIIHRLLERGGRVKAMSAVLERAGVKTRLQDVVLLMVVGMVVAGAAGYLLVGPLVGLLLAAVVPLGVRVRFGALASKRERAFAEQLDDSLQLMANSLRAGHSLQQGLAAVASEAEEPTSVEFARIINETRVGRELGHALDEAARRMNSEDFVWVTQAIAINREVGGNLAEVLDGVGETIRERGAIRRQVKALAAEGKLSAYVLMALPFGIAGFLMMSNPAYMAKFTQSLAGYAMMVAAVVLLVIGGLWLRKTVQVKF
jgi:tight adherence protein B